MFFLFKFPKGVERDAVSGKKEHRTFDFPSGPNWVGAPASYSACMNALGAISPDLIDRCTLEALFQLADSGVG